MWLTNEKNKFEVESQADSQLSMIDTHGSPCMGTDEYEMVESIREIFRPDFTVYVQKHAGTTVCDDIPDQTLKRSSIETQGFVQNKLSEHSLASLMPVATMITSYPMPT